MEISVSDAKLFLKCRRAWDWQSPNRRGLRPVAGPATSPWRVGAGVHAALAAQAKGEDPLVAYHAFALGEERTFLAHHYTVSAAEPWPLEMQALWDDLNFGRVLVERYFDHHGAEHPLGEGYAYLPGTVEQTFRVPIPGTLHVLVGTVDGLARDADGRVYVVEHKSFSQRPNRELLLHDLQFAAYAWATTALMGEEVAGVLYDGIAKKVPVGPTMLKDGTLSRKFDASVDEQTYLAAIAKFELHPDDYADVLARLHGRDAGEESPYWVRWKLPITRHQRATVGELLAGVATDMVLPTIYPNFSWATCPTCGVRDLCRAQQYDDDVDYLVRTRYTTGDGGPSFARQGGELVAVDATGFAEMTDL